MGPAALTLWLSLAAGLPGTSLASTPSQTVVLLAPEERLPILGPLVQAIRAQLSDLPVHVEVERVGELAATLGGKMRAARQLRPDALAVVWLELLSSEPLVVYVDDPRHDRVLARTVEWDAAAGHLEAVGLIVRSSVQGLLTGTHIGFEAGPRTEPVRAPTPATGPEKPAAPTLGLALELGYSPSLLAPDIAAQHGLDVGLQVGLGPRFYLAARYRLMAPFLRRAKEYALALVWRHPASLGAGVRFQAGPVQLSAELGATVEPVIFDIRDVGPWGAMAPSQRSTHFAVAPLLEGALPLFSGLSAVLAAGADLSVGERRYQLDSAGGRKTLLEPWPVQPRALVGLRWVAR